MADRRLKIFHTVARLLNFTKAAEELHMTQPAVTFQIRQLEEQFNTRLFDRTHNKVTLTDVGKQVYSYSDRILKLYEDMTHSITEMTGDVSGSVTLGASTTIAEYMLPLLIGEFKVKYPEVMINLRESNTEDIVNMVENNDIDLGVVEAPVLNKNLVVENCRNDRLVAIVPPQHELSGQREVRLKDLLKYAYIAREEGSGTREVIEEYLSSAGLKPSDVHVAMELGSPEAIKGAVEAGMGVSIVSEVTIHKELKLGTLVALDLELPLERPFSFVHQKQKFRQRAMDELLEFARAYCLSHRDDG